MAGESPTIKQYLHMGGWNILFDLKNGDRVRPQADRLAELAATIARAQDEAGMPFDFLGILEAQKGNDFHNGELLGEKTGLGAGMWKPHSRMKSGEHIGAIGTRVDGNVDFHDLSPGAKKAATVRLGDVLLGATHFNFEKFGHTRTAQAQSLMEVMGDEQHVAVVLDPNCLAWQAPRQAIENAGFQSAFALAGYTRVRSALTNRDYRRSMLTRRERLLVGRGLWVDDLYVKGIPVVSAQTYEGESDHSLISVVLDVSELNLVQNSDVGAERV